jgi:N-acetylglucosamine kinase-like BadF-type ATPase/DNA-binding Xre family transcriptional regulator
VSTNKDRVAKQVAENLKTMMAEHAISNADLAKRCDITRSTVSKILSSDINISAQMLVKLSNGLKVQPNDILEGLTAHDEKFEASTITKSDSLFAGILSIDKKRLTCIKTFSGKVVGVSELDSDLDLAETLPHVYKLIEGSIRKALQDTEYEGVTLKHIHLICVVQSYEFTQTRRKFEDYARRYFHSIKLIPDWQITYLSTFDRTQGICLVVDKGVSLSYLHESRLRKIWGWKYPVYDLGGENWLGVQAIRHTVEAEGGFVPMSELASNILTKYSGRIENILEACFKKDKDPDVYCKFADTLLRCYFLGDPKSVEIISEGFRLVYRAIAKVDEVTGKPLKISIHGSLADIYKTFIKKERFLDSVPNVDKADLLADVSHDLMVKEENSIYTGIIF